MTDNEVRALIDQLEWNLDSDKEAVMTALQVVDDEQISFLLQPGKKSMWDYAAETIVRIGYPRCKPVIPGIFAWLQDPNWPGARIIFDFLCGLDTSILMPYVEDALREAGADRDSLWICTIDSLLDAKGITVKDFEDKAVYEILKMADE